MFRVDLLADASQNLIDPSACLSREKEQVYSLQSCWVNMDLKALCDSLRWILLILYPAGRSLCLIGKINREL